MPRVDFYVLKEANHLLFACRLMEKIYQQNQTVLALVEEQSDATKLDQLLWTFNETSFIPHEIIDSAKSDAPIGISTELLIKSEHEILFNLSNTIPNCFNQYSRVIELVPVEQALKDISRQHFRFYREQQCELFTHDLTK